MDLNISSRRGVVQQIPTVVPPSVVQVSPPPGWHEATATGIPECFGDASHGGVGERDAVVRSRVDERDAVGNRTIVPDVDETRLGLRPSPISEENMTPVLVRQSPEPQAMPGELKRLRDFNAPGLKESTSPCRTRLRARHSSNG